MRNRRSDRSRARRATRGDIVDLIRKYNVPIERLRVADWPALARALVREARRYDLRVPRWLAAIAGYRDPPASLRLVRGRDAERMKAINQERRSGIERRGGEGRGIILVGAASMIGHWSVSRKNRRGPKSPTK